MQSRVEEGLVVVVEYDPEWPAAYAREAARLVEALGDAVVAMEHVGSTSVPGLTAKPIVDILIAMRVGGAPAAAVLSAMARCDYEALGEDGRRPGRWMFRKRAAESFNVSFVPADSWLWHDNLRVRDYLRRHPDEAAAYAAIKRAAASASPDSLLGYQDLKRGFVTDLVARARVFDGTAAR